MVKFIRRFFAQSRFLRVWEKLERDGFNLYVLQDKTTSEYERKVRNYIKNTNRVAKLYKKLYGKD